MNTTERITSRRGVLGGFPCFEGTRIPYDTILRLVDHDTITEHDVPEYFPSLSIGAWRVAAEYAIDQHLAVLEATQPNPPVEDDFGDASIGRAMRAARERGEDIENMPNPSRLRPPVEGSPS